MSAATHNKTNRRGKVYLSHKEWKKRQNISKALKQYMSGKKRADKSTYTSNPPVASNTIKSNFNYYEGGETK